MADSMLRRLLRLVAGIAVSAVGIVMMLRANIGLEPWSVLQQGISQSTGMTYGVASMLVGAIAIGVAVLYGERFGVGTLLNIFLCGACIDLLLWLDWVPQMHSLPAGIAMLLGGLELLVLGTWMYMRSALGVGPRDALMVALARKTGRSVGLCRVVIELGAIVVGYLLGGQVGLGTVIGGVGLGSLFDLNFHLLRFQAAQLHQESMAETLHRLRGRRPQP
ncbi:MAG: hypothetical protein Q4D31_06205 [Eubacteriales bacterium]|nr:hypothetical protein [Eubacteriales bacterium]